MAIKAKLDKELLEYLETYVTEKRKDLFRKVLAQRTRHFTVVLEDIYQPHNSSAVMRSCDVFGIQDIHVIENKYTSKVSRHVAKGSQKWLSFYRYNSDLDNTKECISKLKNSGYHIIGTTPHNDSCFLPEFDVSKKTAFVFGKEKEGISDLVKDNCDGFLKVPMVGFTESLNISVAAAIILNEVTSRVKQSNINWNLTTEEQEELYLEWVEKSIKNVDKIKAFFLSSKR